MRESNGTLTTFCIAILVRTCTEASRCGDKLSASFADQKRIAFLAQRELLRGFVEAWSEFAEEKPRRKYAVVP
jgi:hypothetical protein